MSQILLQTTQPAIENIADLCGAITLFIVVIVIPVICLACQNARIGKMWAEAVKKGEMTIEEVEDINNWMNHMGG